MFETAMTAMLQQNSQQRRGSMTMECVLAFPLVVVLMLAVMQFSHIWLARQVVQYAAFCAARATLVCETGEFDAAAQQAAEQVCAWIVKGHAPGEPDKVVPGWGGIPGSGGVHRKTRTRVTTRAWNVEVEVEHDFALILPIVGQMIGWYVNPWQTSQEWLEQRADETGNIGSADVLFHPHIRFRERAILPKPYVTVLPSGLPGGW